MLSCSEIMALHSDFLDGALGQMDAETVRLHLVECAECARYDRVLRNGLRVLASTPYVEPEPEFLHQLHTRLADEERRASAPISASMATSVSVAAMLALAAWLPMMLLSRPQAAAPGVANGAGNGDVASWEIAWHGGPAVEKHRSHARLANRSVRLASAHAHVSLIDRGYSPLILDDPTAPPARPRVTLTSVQTR